ncbi:4-hydroxy-3-methylbut-2-enyl diphosphate reductase [Porphyromonas pogonae]|uniref:4-hydroxy-3-methylbut-2-enyl diphosphate reductase n=1 Tax=Porphyromonas pogonae TaxID=867595 RepID=UPI002E791E36|nr:4-hydroxy-3-methylbut-2-enyl diphosphate reductase [Porphyromonas pogonae]
MQLPIIEIDEKSGFCFGVINAIKHAEKELEDSSDKLYCLGDIVHNNQEVDRLEKKGMQTINYDTLKTLKNARVLFRAHGEPPEIYKMAQDHNINLVDATCPVVVRLQQSIRNHYQSSREQNAQIVIYGKQGHAEVNGLVGQTGGDAIVVQDIDDLNKVDFSRPVILFSQTTKPLDGFHELINEIERRIEPGVSFEYNDTICRQVANRIPHIQEFAQSHELVIFVAGTKSSNGKVLFGECRKSNPNSIFVSSPEQLTLDMLMPLPHTIGICGATSTPKWQMEQISDRILSLLEGLKE